MALVNENVPQGVPQGGTQMAPKMALKENWRTRTSLILEFVEKKRR